MKIRTHISVSLDGFVADADGLSSWEALPHFDGDSHGYNAFMAGCGAVVIGRATFDQALSGWLEEWPWPGLPVFVLTSSPLSADAPDSVIASMGGPAGLVEQIRAAGIESDVQLLGGPRTIEAFIAVGGLDELGIVVLPLLLGSGVPLFSAEAKPFSPERWAASRVTPVEAPPRPLFELVRHETFADGSMHLVYAPTR